MESRVLIFGFLGESPQHPRCHVISFGILAIRFKPPHPHPAGNRFRISFRKVLEFPISVSEARTQDSKTTNKASHPTPTSLQFDSDRVHGADGFWAFHQ